MAKKGGIQQLQAEINNDDEFEKFLDRYPNALLVLDIYSEWCGPCLGVVNALRKIKMELGGDKLQLAICKTDYITRLSRFRKKSEPTWLFVRDHQSVNLMFGSNVPDLLSVIKRELAMVDLPISKRTYIGIEELHPEEQRRERIKKAARDALEFKERYEREKKRHDYLMHCTDAILENLPDIGVSIFGTHVTRDMFKKINEPAEALKMQCKDRRYQPVTREDFETANFVCDNPLPEDVIEQMIENNVLICFWKISDESGQSIPHVMNQYVHELTKQVVEPPDEYNAEERVIPPILEPAKISVEYEVDANVVCPTYEDEIPKESVTSVKVSPTEEEFFVDEEMGEEEDAHADQVAMPTLDMAGLDLDDGSENVEEEEEESSEKPPPTKMCTRIVKMPAVWVPNDERTHAAFIYAFFRPQTNPFLPPDPPPEPPHVIMAFDTYKKRDLISLAERNKNDIPLYGFFTSDDADEAKLIANSTQKYLQNATPGKQAEDKLVFKVNKRTSHMMLTLATYGATYVSPNTTVGKEEALKFFPETYVTVEQERQAAMEAQKGEDGKLPPAPEPEKEAPEAENEDIVMEDDIGEGADGEEGEYGEGEYGEGAEMAEGMEGEGLEEQPGE